jgi:hypothetical protein
MTRRGRIESIADHALAARRLALAAEEDFLVVLIDMVLFESGKLLAAAAQEQDAAPESPAGVRRTPTRVRPSSAVALAPKRRRPGSR